MITKGIEEATAHLIEEVFCAGAEGANMPEYVTSKQSDVLSLIRAEAINLADKIIGKDRLLHSSVRLNDQEYLDPADKAAFDLQVAQRLMLAEYQKPKQGVPTGPEVIINEELSPNEE